MARNKGRSRWHCKACDKTSFGSASRAGQTLSSIQRGGSARPRSPQRTYPCPFGNGHHLTSKADRTEAPQ